MFSSEFRYKAKLDDLKKLKEKFQKQIESTKETVKNNKKYIDEKICQDPIAILLESHLSDFNFTQTNNDAENDDEIRSFKETFSDTESLILQTWYVPYDHKQHLTEQEEMLNLINSVRSIQSPIEDIWEELVKVLQGRLPVEMSSIEQYEIKKKVVQLQMLSECVKKLKVDTKSFFKSILDQNSQNKWDMVIKTGSAFKKNLVNLLKIFITFLEDEQLLMIARGEDIVASMQEIANINSELWTLITKLIWILESLNINYKVTINQLYKAIKDMKKEIDTLHKTLRRKSTMMYTYIYETNDFQKVSSEEQEEFSQGKNILYKKIVNFFLPYKNILNNLHCFLISASANTESIRNQIGTCQNSVLSVEAVGYVPKTENFMNICRVQSLDTKQVHQNNLLRGLNSICRKVKVEKKQRSVEPIQEISVPESGRSTYTPAAQSMYMSTDFELGSGHRAIGQRHKNEQKSPYKYGGDSYDNLSGGSDNDPVSMSMFIPQSNLPAAQEEPKKESASKMAMKMKSMQDMLNQKLKKVKNINWNVDE